MIADADLRDLARNFGSLSALMAQPLSVLSDGTYSNKLRQLRRQLSASPDSTLQTEVEWFLDNYYLIAETAAQIAEDVPRRFYRELPVVVSSGTPLPRIYLLAAALLDQADGPPNKEQLIELLASFQERVPLRIGELWAFPAMVRARCLERIVGALESFDDGQDVDEDDVVAVAVRTLIAVRSIKWREVFEATSLVHRELCRDPLESYEEMDFSSCDRYRRVVEALARLANRDEHEVARVAVSLAKGAPRSGPAQRHVGFYLIDRGRRVLEEKLGIRRALHSRLGRALRRYPSFVYLVVVAIATFLAIAPVAHLYWSRSTSVELVAVAILVALVPASGFAIAWVQWGLTRLFTPQRLPRLDLSTGIPDTFKTLVVMPTLLGNLNEVHRLVSRLELHYLANPDSNLGFALLADYTDATTKVAISDASLLARAREGIELLNERYCRGSEREQRPFHLLVRERRLNQAEGVWMGWERKRGKLEELNRLLAGDMDTSYSVHVGDPDGLANVRFVITLDSDTELPRDAARKLVSILAHPLNRPRFDGKRVVSGYTVLQPRLDISPEAANRSRFSRVFASDVGLDIYSRAVSDVYQDFFGVGVYVGKGIYDIDAFRRSVEGRAPENSILSHDLFEGINGRVGLVSDVVLYEDYPPSYMAYAGRLHRWIRGDWQLLPWLRFRVPSASGERIPNPFLHIDRWKMLDNLRRSLMPLSLLALLVSAWTWLPGNPLVWTVVALVLSLGHVLTGLASRSPRFRSAARWLLSIVFLPHEALIVVDAIARTVVRIVITRKRLLEWTTAFHQTRKLANRDQRRLAWTEMIAGPLAAVAVVILLAAINPAALPLAAPFALLWLLAPEVAVRLSKPLVADVAVLGPSARGRLRLLARRTWLFFETFVGPEDNWLPPDNVQHQPSTRIAHRTSPTNIGLYLVSCATALDLGHIGIDEFCSRTRSAFRSIESLERHRGQLLNWYESTELRVLAPAYVSTVDNGNFAASLIALRGASTYRATAPLFRDELWRGLEDVAALLASATRRLPTEVCDWTDLEPVFVQLAELCKNAQGRPSTWLRRLASLSESVSDLSNQLQSVARQCVTAQISIEPEILDWLELLDRHVGVIRDSVEPAASWFFSLSDPPSVLAEDIALAHECRQLKERGEAVGLDGVSLLCDDIQEFAESLIVADEDDIRLWAERLRREAAAGRAETERRLRSVLDIACACDDELALVDFSFLYDREARLLHIGYDVAASRPDSHHYDLLASEARLASLIAIALGQVPTEHWVHLGRPVARVGGLPTLLSWSGTMFEYLMPLLFTRSFSNTLLGVSSHSAIRRQIGYGKEREVPWGISESGFAVTDRRGDYQYRAFGVPGLGLSRGLGDEVVVAPYASLLAIGVAPQEVLANVDALESVGALSEYGLCEAIDYTTNAVATEPRLSVGSQTPSLVDAHMAHHQGMILVGIGNVLATESMVSRFHRDPRIQTVSHLLHERTIHPRRQLQEHVRQPPTVVRVPSETVGAWRPSQDSTELMVDPSHHILSNGSLSVACDAFGHTRLWRGDMELRPRELASDPRQPGSFCFYLKVGSEPATPFSGVVHGSDVTYRVHRVEAVSRHGSLSIHHELGIAPHEDIEVRVAHLANEGTQPLSVIIAAASEVSIHGAGDYHRHPAFSKLFVETSAREQGRVLVCSRRPRDPSETFPVLAQAVVGCVDAEFSWDTARESFVGRGRGLQNPAALDDHTPLAGQKGTVLDPCLAQRLSLVIEPGQRQSVAWLTAVADDEDSAVKMLSALGNVSAITATLENAERASQRRVRRFQIAGTELPSIQRFGSQLIARPRLRASGQGTAIRSLLWGHGISGDRPLVVFHRRTARTPILRFLVRAHQYFADQGFEFDLAIVNHLDAGYLDEVREDVRSIVRDLVGGRPVEAAVIAARSVAHGEIEALEAAAAFVCSSESVDIASELERGIHRPRAVPFFEATLEAKPEPTPVLERPSLEFDNGIGGFESDGDSYVIILDRASTSSPAPWCNILANPSFGCMVSERGFGCSWAKNSGENRLTPWSNDPIADPPSEVVYLRDEETGEVWTPTPAPRPAQGSYRIDHEIGATRYRHRSHGLKQTLSVIVHAEEPVKIVTVALENLSGRERRITATYFADWVLGTRWPTSAPAVTQWFSATERALFARNPLGTVFPEQVAFLASSEKVHGFTGDRDEFLGAEGVAAPEALKRWGLSNADAGARTCAALQVHIDLAAGETRTLHFALGWGANEGAARMLASRAIASEFAQVTQASIAEFWRRHLGALEVKTPDPAANRLLNRWALYQTISSRLFARSAFYQSSGAYGFRDQLQDVMALSWSAPSLAREHILRAASHQFSAGDVLHWWHPPDSRGVRTRCSDDLLWLPYVTAHYIETTGDASILHEAVPFVRGAELKEDEVERYDVFSIGADSRPLLEHCLRALDRGNVVGPNGLPLMGAGDWNDGMNLVGARGRGESVWLGWFLFTTLRRFERVVRAHNGDARVADQLAERAGTLIEGLEGAWDGKWYRRAYFDSGSPLGSASSTEARIDSISQSWAVLSGAARPERARQAIAQALDALVDVDSGLIRLLDPPFDGVRAFEVEPGYIAGYPPGVRENGAQYTHAAVWLAWAVAELGDRRRLSELFHILNPIKDRQPTAMQQYRVEPYVVSADVYSDGVHRGRGGWSWYTGAAGWLWRLGIEAMLGINCRWPYLEVRPRTPPAWPGYSVTIRQPKWTLILEVETRGSSSELLAASLDGERLSEARVDLRRLAGEHRFALRFGREGSRSVEERSNLAPR